MQGNNLFDSTNGQLKIFRPTLSLSLFGLISWLDISMIADSSQIKSGLLFFSGDFLIVIMIFLFPV